MRLIDADINVYDYVETWDCTCSDYGRQKVMAVDDLSYLPTVDAVPVKHGEWLIRHVGHGHYWECSVCHKNPCIYVTEHTNFCPNCGAKMEDNDEQTNNHIL